MFVVTPCAHTWPRRLFTLALLALLSVTAALGQDITIYVRSMDDVPLTTHVFNDYNNSSVWKQNTPFGTEDGSRTASEAVTLGGHTWYKRTVNRSLIYKVGDTDGSGNTVQDAYFNIQFRTQDGLWYSGAWGLQATQGGPAFQLPNELFFQLDPNATTVSNSWTGVRELIREQAEGKDVVYYIVDKNGNRIQAFDPVRNQNQGLHTMSYNNYAATVWSSKIFTGDASNFEFCVKAYVRTIDNNNQAQYQEISSQQYRPYGGQATLNYTQANKYATGLSNVVSRLSDTSNNNFFSLPKTNDGVTPASFTFTLNTHDYWTTDLDHDFGNRSIKADGTILYNGAPGDVMNFGTRSLAVHANLAQDGLVPADETLYVISNMQQTYHEYWENAEVDADASTWDLTEDRPMTLVAQADKANLILAHPQVGETNDVIYAAEVKKPRNSISSIFMAFATKADREAIEALTDDNTGEQKQAAWNKVIRPFVNYGKDAIGMFGGLYRPVDYANGNQALSPGADDNFYTKCMVYVNLTKSTYLVVPVGSYDLTGPAVRYFDPTRRQWCNTSGTSEEYWGNGEASFWSTPLTFNAEDNCWQYTGMFYNSVGYDESAGENNQNAFKGFYGFRFLTNHLYTINYREDYDRPAATQQTDYSPIWAAGADPSLHEDSYYYNHVDIDPDVNPAYTGDRASADMIKGGSLNADREKLHNINFSLASGYYTIKFYPEGTEADPHPFYTLAPAEDPGTTIPDDTEDDDITVTYKYLRTFSSVTARRLSDDLKCFIVTDYNTSSHEVQLTSIPYIPANTGVILAYTKTEPEKLAGSDKGMEIADGIYDWQPYMVIDRLTPADSATYAADAAINEKLAHNKLMPTTYKQADGTVVNGAFTVNTSDFRNGNINDIQYRNYNFTFLRAKSAEATNPNKYRLGFWRIITGEVSPARAYLRLTGEESGGTTPLAGYDNGLTSKVMGESFFAKPVYNAFVIDYPDWKNSSDTNTTTINTIDAMSDDDMQSSACYTLQGVRIAKPTAPGVYIANGRKVVVR
jgi:hypothetical protein